MKNKLIIPVGISASGKSTFVEKLNKDNEYVIISTDNIRAELSHYQDQSMNDKVFEMFYKRIRENLLKGNNVIADATNITMKSRRAIINKANGIDCEIICYLIVKDIASCIEHDSVRRFSVGEGVIQKQVGKFQTPFKNEGYDKIEIIDYVSMSTITTIDNFADKIRNFEQHNNYHNLTVGEHQTLSVKYAIRNSYPKIIKDALRFHDIGKFFTQTFDDSGNAHYYGHESYGAYIMLEWCVYHSFLHYDIKLIELINYHMIIQNRCTSEKSINKYKKIFGEEMYSNLLLMNKADKYRGD